MRVEIAVLKSLNQISCFSSFICFTELILNRVVGKLRHASASLWLGKIFLKYVLISFCLVGRFAGSGRFFAKGVDGWNNFNSCRQAVEIIDRKKT